MHSFEEVMKAKTLLGLRDNASLAEIKARYKNLMHKWHPDKHLDEIETATKMSSEIITAYKIILEYVKEYEYRFDEEYIKKRSVSPQEWWESHFGGR
ncbi:J domain-containing protein [bacterium]|jgi:DnaJ-class molecular chaperone|nr:J domain-containing protein [bacterium]